MRILHNTLDVLGFSASFLCALHCIAMPLVMTMGLAGALPWLESATLEWSLILSTLIIATWSLLSTYQQHQNWRPLLFAAVGFTIILGGHAFPHALEHYVAAVGGFAIAYAHFINWTLLQKRQEIFAGELS